MGIIAAPGDRRDRGLAGRADRARRRFRAESANIVDRHHRRTGGGLAAAAAWRNTLAGGTLGAILNATIGAVIVLVHPLAGQARLTHPLPFPQRRLS